MYEYVAKKEYIPVRENIEKIIKNVQGEVRNYLTFQYRLVGSGKRHLITREKGSNSGFDFDYNFEIQKVDKDYNDAEKIRQLIFKALKKVLSKTN